MSALKVSPSALKRSACLRRWAAEKVGGYSEPGGKAAVFGQAVHKQLERWMKYEAEPDVTRPEGRLALEFLPFIPSRDLQAERPMGLTIEGIPFHGYIDFSGKIGDTLHVGDYKTTGDPNKWGLTTPELMLKDEQVILYSFSTMIDYGCSDIKASWLYADTSKKRFAFASEINLTLSQTEDLVESLILPPARQLVQLKNQLDVVDLSSEKVRLKVLNEIRNNPYVCGWGAYNCSFRSHCEVFSQQTTQIETGDEVATELTLKEKLALVRAEAAAAKQALEEAVTERHLPAEEQNLGRKAAEATEKAKAKTEKAAAKKPAQADLAGALAILKQIEDSGVTGEVSFQLGAFAVTLKV